jgi:signal peptidase I
MESNKPNPSLTTEKDSQEDKLSKGINYKEKSGFWWETTKFALIVLFIVIPVRLYVVQPFIVSGESMEYTFNSGQYLLVDELSYLWSNPERGDVIVFHYPLDTKKYFIKRIIGLPGDTVEIHSDQVIIKNKENPNGIVLEQSFLSSDLLVNNANYKQDFIVPDGQYFVMGDNRLHSSDSRVWGMLSRNLIVGRPVVRLLQINSSGSSWLPVSFISPSDMGPYPGEHREIDGK